MSPLRQGPYTTLSAWRPSAKPPPTNPSAPTTAISGFVDISVVFSSKLFLPRDQRMECTTSPRIHIFQHEKCPWGMALYVQFRGATSNPELSKGAGGQTFQEYQICYQPRRVTSVDWSRP